MSWNPEKRAPSNTISITLLKIFKTSLRALEIGSPDNITSITLHTIKIRDRSWNP